MTLSRKALDLIFSIGGLLLALLLLIVGLVLQNQANFAKTYVADQLGAQKIVFSPAERLTEDEKKIPCVVENAGQALTTGVQAECYSKYIGLHLGETNDGKTYAQTSTESRTAATEAKKARDANAPNAAELEAKAKGLDGKVQTLFRGETLRGLLLTSYGFSIFGERAGQVALVAFAVAAILFLASIAGFLHGLSADKKTERV